ncbi:MAG: Lin1244/Lin1753 domain-containing protein [Alloprevotella sp.]
MARPTKETVDYYPHFVKGGRTIFILESKYGNDGYAFWFKLLEILGDAEGHHYDCSVPNNWAYLLAKTRCDEDTAKDIMNTLLTLGKIDSELWESRQIIWCQNFVDNISSVYKMRHADIPTPPSFCEEKPKEGRVSFSKNPNGCGLIGTKTDKEEKSREKERKEDIVPYRVLVDCWNEICGNALPKVKALSEQRKQKIKIRLSEWGKDEEEQLAKARELFGRVAASRFLRGENNTGWAASFDWIFDSPRNWVKVMEGNYDNDRGARAKQQQVSATLGPGEYIEHPSGRRTYGTGRVTIPAEAPPRPSERHSWDAANGSWILI